MYLYIFLYVFVSSEIYVVFLNVYVFMAFQTRILKYYFILIGVYTNYNKNKNNPLQTAKPKILFKKWKNTKKYEKNNTIHNGCWRSGPEV